MWKASSREVAEIAGRHARQMQMARAEHIVRGVIVERQMARRRALTKVFDRRIAAVVVLHFSWKPVG